MAVAILSGAPAPALAGESEKLPLSYRLSARLAPDLRSAEGTVEISWTVPPGPPRDAIPLVLYANLYAAENPALDDITYPWCFPRGFDAGGVRLGEVRTGAGEPCGIEDASGGAWPPWPPWPPWPMGTLVLVRLPRPAPPGAVLHVLVPFRTTFPRRYGSFGLHGGILTANGGLCPHVAGIAPDGTPIGALPPEGSWRVEIRVPPDTEVLLNGAHTPPLWPDLRADLRARWLTLAAGPRFHRHEAAEGGLRVVYWRRSRWDAAGETVAKETLVSLATAERLRGRPFPMGPARAVTLVEAPLRDVFTRAGDGCALVSDRALLVFSLLEKYHLKEIATAALARALAPEVAAREAPRDLPWAIEAAAWELRRAVLAERAAEFQEVSDVVQFFSFLPIVDQERVAPRFAFADVYFDTPHRADRLREDVAVFASRAPDGRVVAEKLRDSLGPRADALLRRHAGLGGGDPPGPLRAEAGPAFARKLDTWLAGLAPRNYRLGAVRETPLGEGRVRVEAEVRREGGEGVVEDVEIGVTLSEGDPVLGRVEVGGEGATDAYVYPSGASRIEVDPRGRLVETSRADNTWPPRLQLLWDNFESHASYDPNRGRVEVFQAFSVVRSGDYRDRLTAVGFTEQEGRGFRIGLHHSEGWKHDVTEYPFTAGLRFAYEELAENFASTRSGRRNDEGEVASLEGVLRWDTRVDRFNPHSGVAGSARLEWSDGWLGTDFRFLRAEAGATFLLAFWREHVGALEVRLGASDGDVPTQRLFAAGGEEAIRGLRAGDLLGEHILLMRIEYRHLLATAVDEAVEIPLLGLGYLRRIQGAAFVEWASVADDFDDLDEVEGIVMGWGYGLRLFFDAFGARYTMIRLDLAWRLDDRDSRDPLVYLGASHSF